MLETGLLKSAKTYDLMMNEPISSIMTTQLITINPEDSLQHAYDILRSKRIHHLPVVEGRKLVGIITTYDIFKLNMAPDQYAKTKAKEIMTTRLATLGPNDKVGSVVLIFVENLFHAVPIVDDDGNAVGLVTTLDVMKYSLKKEYPGRYAAWGR